MCFSKYKRIAGHTCKVVYTTLLRIIVGSSVYQVASAQSTCALRAQTSAQATLSYFKACARYPALEDHPTTQNREPLRGVASSVIFIDHEQPEDGLQDAWREQSVSRTNEHEALACF